MPTTVITRKVTHKFAKGDVIQSQHFDDHIYEIAEVVINDDGIVRYVLNYHPDGSTKSNANFGEFYEKGDVENYKAYIPKPKSCRATYTVTVDLPDQAHARIKLDTEFYRAAEDAAVKGGIVNVTYDFAKLVG